MIEQLLERILLLLVRGLQTFKQLFEVLVGGQIVVVVMELTVTPMPLDPIGESPEVLSHSVQIAEQVLGEQLTKTEGNNEQRKKHVETFQLELFSKRNRLPIELD